MTTRKSAANREKDLRLAIRRIETGRSNAGIAKLSIASVAREVGISSALIHNHYPGIAELIRNKQCASSRQQRDAKHVQLALAQKKNTELLRELQELQRQIKKLVTLNEMLLIENNELTAKLKTGNIFNLNKR